MTRPAKLDAHNTRKVAVAAGCDPRTVTSYLEGNAVRGPVKARIKEALEALKIHAPDAGEPMPREEAAR